MHGAGFHGMQVYIECREFQNLNKDEREGRYNGDGACQDKELKEMSSLQVLCGQGSGLLARYV